MSGRAFCGWCCLALMPGFCSAQALPDRIAHPTRFVSITGTVGRLDRFYGRDVMLQAKYVFHPADKPDHWIRSIPIGAPAHLAADGRFSLTVPDLTGELPESAELRIHAIDAATGEPIAQLVVADAVALHTAMGGLRIAGEYPPLMLFTPCTTTPPRAKDSFGFALRPGSEDACDR